MGIGFSVLTTPALIGQIDRVLETDTDTLQVVMTAAAGKLAITWKELVDSKSPARKEFLSITDVQLYDGDLILLYKLPKPDRGHYYQTRVRLRQLVVDSLSLSQERILPSSTVSAENFELEKRIVWANLTEDALFYGQTYQIYLTVENWGEINCTAVRPEFGIARQWPHYTLAGVGLTLLGAGQIYRQQKESAYSEYENLWLQGKSQEDANRPFSNAQRSHESAKTLTYAGWAVMGVNALWAAYRYRRVKRAQREYDKYCADGLSHSKMRPTFSLTPNSLGLALHFNR
jgi:hypothetical protein